MDSKSTVKVAVIQASPIPFNKDDTTLKALRLIEEASKEGAKILLFPEAFIPAYPRGLAFGIGRGSKSNEGRKLWQLYWENSLEIPGREADLIAEVSGDLKVYVAIGAIERVSGYRSGTLYCSILYFSPQGRFLGRHRKVRATGIERLIWAEGDGSTLTVFHTEYGRVGGLICWENYMPLARTALYGKGVEIYLAPTADSRDTWISTLVHIACEGRCFVLGCNQFVRKDMFPTDLPGIGDLDSLPDIICRGGSAIISPFGSIIKGPLYNKEGILYAELNLSDIIRAKLDFDPVGHYSRPDIFQLKVDETEKRAVSYIMK